MSNERFRIDMDGFYIMLAIIFWFIGCLFIWNYPIIALFLYTIGLVFVIYAFDEMLYKAWRSVKMNKYWGLSYAPHKCKQFCCGDCVIDMRTCTVTYDECTKPEKELKPEILNEINEVNR